MSQTEVPELAPIGHNRAPESSPLQERLEEAYAKAVAEVEALADRAERLPAVINTDAQQGEIGNFAKEVSRSRKNIEARRVGEKEPFLRAEREVDGFFVPYRDWLDRIAEDMGKRGKEYMDRKAAEERRKRDDEEARRREEARLAQEEAARKIKEAAEAQRRADEAARAARAEEDRRLREADRLRREEEDRIARAAAAARREEEERERREAENASRQKRQAMEKLVRERREREEAEAAEAARVRAEEDRRAREAAAKAEEERRAAAEESDRKMREAKEALAAAEQAENERQEAQRLADAAPAEMARTRASGSLSTLTRGYDFEVTDWAAIDLNALKPYIPRADIEKFVRAFVKVHKDAAPLAGVRVYPTTKAQYR